ncbi:MAG: hypothetical protein OCD00_18295 [Colwellia sp.]
MKKVILKIGILLSILMLASCGNAQDDKIVGDWENEAMRFGFSISADGSIGELSNGKPGAKNGTWKLTKEAPITLQIFEKELLKAEFNVVFISDDEIEFDMRGKKIKMKRIN